MAISKTINRTAKTHRGMKRCICYVLQENKVRDGYICMTGVAPTVLTPDAVYKAFLKEKNVWEKDFGRMYNHNVISFPPDEKITPEQALAFGKEFAENWFPKHQTLVAVHQDTDHLHMHLITNTVSYEDGYKLHNTKNDLLNMKTYTNELCRKYGLSVTEKGKDNLPEGEIRAWDKNVYHLLIDDSKKSYLAECGIAVMESKEQCNSKETFIDRMKERGWTTIWEDKRKHIIFTNQDGKKVRDSNLSKHFSMHISKEELLHEFETANESQSTTDRLSGKLQTDGRCTKNSRHYSR